MRPVFAALALGAFGATCLTPDAATARHRRVFGRHAQPVAAGCYCPAPMAYYDPPPMPGPFHPPAGHLYSPQYAPPQAAAATTLAVRMVDNSFQPGTITVAPGTTVVWTNAGRHRHTVTASTGHWDSGPLDPGQTYSATFGHPGTYDYSCTLHAKEMKGTVVVK